MGSMGIMRYMGDMTTWAREARRTYSSPRLYEFGSRSSHGMPSSANWARGARGFPGSASWARGTYLNQLGGLAKLAGLAWIS